MCAGNVIYMNQESPALGMCDVKEFHFVDQKIDMSLLPAGDSG